MIYGLYLSAAGALMESARLSVIANNLANVNTNGFRDDLAVIRARDAEAREDGPSAYATAMDALGGGALVSETATNHMQGPIHVTDRMFDLAIQGDGFFKVTDGQKTSYTRDGAFSRDSEGRLVMQDGRHMLSEASGRPVQLPREGEVTIARDGTVTADGVAVAKIEMFRFADARQARKVGSNLYESAGAAPALTAEGQIEQGALEASSVTPAAEMVRMILAGRGYEMNMQMIRMQDQTLGDLITLGRLSI